MKRRRTLIVSLLLVTALCMGIGYAAVSGTTLITGNATLTAEEVNLVVSNYTEDDANSAANAVGSVATLGNKSVTYTITGLSKVGDTLIGTMELKNANTYNVEITGCTPTNGTYCAVETDFDTSCKNKILAPNAVVNLKVTVTVTKAAIENNTQDTVKIQIDSTATDAVANVTVP